MEERLIRSDVYRTAIFVLILSAISGLAFALGFAFSASNAQAAEEAPAAQGRVVYPKKTDLDFEGTEIQGEVRDPGDFYFQRKPEEKFDSLVKRRPNFHREMLRDVVLGK